MRKIKMSEGAWDSRSKGDGSMSAKEAGVMGLVLMGQMGVWASGRVPG